MMERNEKVGLRLCSIPFDGLSASLEKLSNGTKRLVYLLCCWKLRRNIRFNNNNIRAGSVLLSVFSPHASAEIILCAQCVATRFRSFGSSSRLCFHILFAQTGWRAGRL